jgi:hypothetical protein
MNRLVFLLFVKAVAQSAPRQLLSPRELQSPGNGISKSTYSCNDPIAAKKFMFKYFPVATPGDECTNDICVCSATSSTPQWEIQQGRAYIPLNGAVEEGRRLQDPGNGFGLHCVNVSNHLTTGGLSTAEVEAHFNTKLGDMKEYDSFMDFSVTFYTSGLAQYASAFDRDQVPYYTTTWQDDNAQSYTSLIVQVDKSQMLLELTSKKSLELGETLRPVHAAAPSTRRVSARALAMIDALEQKNALSGASLTPLSVNRAISAAGLAKIDDFYVSGMGTKKVSEDTDAANGVTRKCYLWSGASVDVCFTNRPDSATKGDWKVGDFENMLNTVHKNIIVGHPYCQVDKWFDNHYAIDSFSADTSKIVSYINQNNVPHVCSSGGGGSGGSGLHSAFDPTGWAIQLDLGFSTHPSDCNSAGQDSQRRLQGTFNPACEPGTCSHLTKSTVVV